MASGHCCMGVDYKRQKYLKGTLLPCDGQPPPLRANPSLQSPWVRHLQRRVVWHHASQSLWALAKGNWFQDFFPASSAWYYFGWVRCTHSGINTIACAHRCETSSCINTKSKEDDVHIPSTKGDPVAAPLQKQMLLKYQWLHQSDHLWNVVCHHLGKEHQQKQSAMMTSKLPWRKWSILVLAVLHLSKPSAKFVMLLVMATSLVHAAIFACWAAAEFAITNWLQKLSNSKMWNINWKSLPSFVWRRGQTLANASAQQMQVWLHADGRPCKADGIHASKTGSCTSYAISTSPFRLTDLSAPQLFV